MCRSIQRLYHVEPPATESDARDAARQFVRKVSGFREPSRANEAAFDQAVRDVADAVERLLDSLRNSAAPTRRHPARQRSFF